MDDKQGFFTAEEEKKALLVSVYKGNAQLETCQEHLQELDLLCQTYGLTVLEKNACSIRKYDASTFITSGKLEELIETSKKNKADVVVFDDEIAPSQQRNLEKAFGIPVIDRTEVILGVFAQRAHTKEAKLQVEYAQVKYQAPRLKRMWTHLSRQQGTGGSGAASKGKGEKQIEIDRRLLHDRLHKLQKDIDEVQAHRVTQRQARKRSGIPVFAIIGYTNAGKSTLINALTESDVFVEDKLFATLDTTTRKFTLENNQEILLTDTVGFIRKLPHLVVAAFRSTLEESIQADILLHVVDVSHNMAEEQADACLEVIKELGAGEKPVITILNKVDACESNAMVNKFRIKYPRTVQVSALEKTGFDDLEDAIIKELEKWRKVVKLRIPQSEYGIVSEVTREGRVLHQDYEGNDVLIRVDLPAAMADRLKEYEEHDS